jgi:hypothetical protein
MSADVGAALYNEFEVEYFVTLHVSEDWSMCTKIRISSFLKKIRISSTNVGSSYDVKVNTSPRGKYTSEY